VSLQDLPSVDRLLSGPGGRELVAKYGRDLALAAIREELSHARQRIRSGGSVPEHDRLLADVERGLAQFLSPTLLPVINATGVILHTNLGRAPLSKSAWRAVRAVSPHYSSLEYDLPSGTRGQRGDHIDGLLQRLTGAEAALMVNNNAGAVLLALASLAHGKEAVVSRTQLIEIGGGFRIPEILSQSGAELVEVGTTNRTHLRDYEGALGPRTGLILRAHHSNFQLVGFTTEPSLAELARVAAAAHVPLVDDLGSGTLLDTQRFGLAHEPTVQESLQAGADLVTFSGDKLLGGPQAGLIVGKAEFVDRLKRHPLARALRPDKLCLAAMADTLVTYLKGEAEEALPVWRMISAAPDSLRERAQRWQQELAFGELRKGESTIGGGSLPGETLPTWLWSLASDHPDSLIMALRSRTPPVVARIEESSLLLDPRTVLPEQDDEVVRALAEFRKRETIEAGE
jgi:L-seryl-tRNA(Ser) seleniumtransferase